MLKFFLLFGIFILLAVASFSFWGDVLYNAIPSWGGLYDSTEQERKLADEVAKETNSWRVYRVLPELRHEETLCPFALRRAKEYAANPHDPKALERLIGENVISLQNSYSQLVEVVGESSTASQFLQMWSEQADARNVLQDRHLTHSCVRCKNQVCAQLFIQQI